MFNKGKYWERVKSGELAAKGRSNHLTRPEAKQPWCTYTETLAYTEASGIELARIHQYRRQDGSLGGKGKPDPKRIFLNGVIYCPYLPPQSFTGRLVRYCEEWLSGIRYKLFG